MAGRRRKVASRPRAAIALVAVPVLVLGVAGLLRWHGAPRGGPAQAAASPAANTPSATAVAVPSRATATPSAPPASPPGRPTPSRPAAVGPVPAGGARQVTFVNAVDQTIWVAGWQQTPQPALPVTGWVLPAGQSLSITVPDHWNGRFWGRTGCSFDGGGHGHCQTGDCAGKFQCTQYGTIPATLAEYNLNAWQNLDFYDVSLVDGSNLPMYINIAHGTTKDPISANGCAKSGCTKAVPCPAELEVTAGGATVGCISPCARFNTDQYCCRAQWAPRSACDPTKWPVDYAAIFKAAEPFAYSYVDDDATSTFTCAGECGYRITFGVTR